MVHRLFGWLSARMRQRRAHREMWGWPDLLAAMNEERRTNR